jgi:serine/threonine protein kinase
MQGLVHCGICPSSVLMRGDKSVCLCDFYHVFDCRAGSDAKVEYRRGHLDYLPPELILAPDVTRENDDACATKQHAPRITTAVDVWQVGF